MASISKRQAGKPDLPQVVDSTAALAGASTGAGTRARTPSQRSTRKRIANTQTSDAGRKIACTKMPSLGPAVTAALMNQRMKVTTVIDSAATASGIQPRASNKRTIVSGLTEPNSCEDKITSNHHV